MVQYALDHPVGENVLPLREKLRRCYEAKGSAGKIVMAFDDVSVPLPPMMSPDIRSVIMECAEAMCMEEGFTDIRFICSIALHRFIRPDEFKHICGDYLYDKYFPQVRMVSVTVTLTLTVTVTVTVTKRERERERGEGRGNEMP